MIGFGSITWHRLTINKETYDSLPDDVKPILHEVASDYQQQTGIVNLDRYAKDIETLRGSITVTEIDPSVRADWGESLAEWPQKMASELDAQGLPALQVLKLTLEAAENNGYNWPVRYDIK